MRLDNALGWTGCSRSVDNGGEFSRIDGIDAGFISPFIHYLPRPAYRRLLPFCSLWYWITRPTHQEANELFDEIGLLNESQMRELFPDGQLIREKFLFFTKSLIMVRTRRN